MTTPQRPADRPRAAAGARRPRRDPLRRPALQRRRGRASCCAGAIGLDLDADQVRRAAHPHRGLGRRSLPGGAVAARPRRRRRLHRRLRRRRPPRGRLPGGRGAGGPDARAPRASCCGPRSWGASRARSATRSPRPTARRGCWPSWSGRTSSWCRSTTGASGTATTTSSASCCATSSRSPAPDEVAALHRRAAAWYLAAGRDRRGRSSHAAAGGDLDGAADLIAEHWAGYERSGWTATTERWLALLPPERVRADPRLCLAAGPDPRSTSGAPDDDRALARRRRGGDGRAAAPRATRGPGRAASPRRARWCGCWRATTPGGVAEGRRAMELTPPARHLVAHARLHGPRDRAARHRRAPRRPTRSSRRPSTAGARAATPRPLVVVSLSHLADTDFGRATSTSPRRAPARRSRSPRTSATPSTRTPPAPT